MIKIWKMNDTDWVAAVTIDEAKQCLADTLNDGKVGAAFEDEFISDPHEISQEEYDDHKLTDEDEASEFMEKHASDDDAYDKYHATCPTFRQALQKMVDDGHEFPSFFATAEI